MKYYCLLFIFFISCNSFDSENNKQKKNIIPSTNIKITRFHKFSNGISKRVFVVNINGAYIYEKPDLNSKIILTANYGNNFQIIGTIGDWFCINSNDNSANTTFYNKIYKNNVLHYALCSTHPLSRIIHKCT